MSVQQQVRIQVVIWAATLVISATTALFTMWTRAAVAELRAAMLQELATHAREEAALYVYRPEFTALEGRTASLEKTCCGREKP